MEKRSCKDLFADYSLACHDRPTRSKDADKLLQDYISEIKQEMEQGLSILKKALEIQVPVTDKKKMENYIHRTQEAVDSEEVRSTVYANDCLRKRQRFAASCRWKDQARHIYALRAMQEHWSLIDQNRAYLKLLNSRRNQVFGKLKEIESYDFQKKQIANRFTFMENEMSESEPETNDTHESTDQEEFAVANEDSKREYQNIRKIRRESIQKNIQEAADETVSQFVCNRNSKNFLGVNILLRSTIHWLRIEFYSKEIDLFLKWLKNSIKEITFLKEEVSIFVNDFGHFHRAYWSTVNKINKNAVSSEEQTQKMFTNDTLYLEILHGLETTQNNIEVPLWLEEESKYVLQKPLESFVNKLQSKFKNQNNGNLSDLWALPEGLRFPSSLKRDIHLNIFSKKKLDSQTMTDLKQLEEWLKLAAASSLQSIQLMKCFIEEIIPNLLVPEILESNEKLRHSYSDRIMQGVNELKHFEGVILPQFHSSFQDAFWFAKRNVKHFIPD